MCSVLLQVDEAPLVGDPLPIFGNKREFDSHNIFFLPIFAHLFAPTMCTHGTPGNIACHNTGIRALFASAVGPENYGLSSRACSA
jgi:hypothetical protein